MKPKDPAAGAAAMRAMGGTRDMRIAEELFDYIMKDAKDQDLMFYIHGMSRNPTTRKYAIQALEQNYDLVSQMLYLVRNVAYASSSSRRGWQAITA